jgi:hypothetical protein
MDSVYRTLRLRGATGTLRVARLQDRDFLVVPVTALVEAVIHPLGSKGHGEFVSRKVLKQSVDTWNGRPCVPDHPMNANGQLVSANLPEVIETQQFGTTFNAQFKNEKELHMEAWLDPARAAIVGAQAMDVITKVRAGQAVEVSVGGYVQYVEREGVYNNQPFGVEWMQITSDHLALGLNGSRGACSVEMGCGAMRGNAETADPIYVVTQTADGLTLAAWQEQPRVPAGQPDGGRWTVDNPMETLPAARSAPFDDWRAKVMALLKSFTTFRANMDPMDMSDDDLRDVLQHALSEAKAGYCQVARVYPERRQVVYVHSPETDGLGDIRFYRQDYSVSKTGKVKLKGEAEPVRPVQTFEAMAETPVGEPDETPAPEAKAACECQEHEEPVMTHRNADKIKALIENPETSFTIDDQAFLEGLTDERLATFLPKAAPVAVAEPPKVEPKVEAPVQAAPVAEAPKVLSAAELAEQLRKLNDEDFIAALPTEARDVVVAARAQAKERREKMLTGLKAATKDAYSAAELEAMPNDQLDKLAKAVGFDPTAEPVAEPPKVEAPKARVYDWTGMAGARQQPEGVKLSDFTPPDPWKDALAARKGA